MAIRIWRMNEILIGFFLLFLRFLDRKYNFQNDLSQNLKYQNHPVTGRNSPLKILKLTAASNSHKTALTQIYTLIPRWHKTKCAKRGGDFNCREKQRAKETVDIRPLVISRWGSLSHRENGTTTHTEIKRHRTQCCSTLGQRTPSSRRQSSTQDLHSFISGDTAAASVCVCVCNCMCALFQSSHTHTRKKKKKKRVGFRFHQTRKLAKFCSLLVVSFLVSTAGKMTVIFLWWVEKTLSCQKRIIFRWKLFKKILSRFFLNFEQFF